MRCLDSFSTSLQVIWSTTYIVCKKSERELSGLVAGDSAICGRLAALILRVRPAGYDLGSSDHLKLWVGLAILKSQFFLARCDLNLQP